MEAEVASDGGGGCLLLLLLLLLGAPLSLREIALTVCESGQGGGQV